MILVLSLGTLVRSLEIGKQRTANQRFAVRYLRWRRDVAPLSPRLGLNGEMHGPHRS